MNHTEELSHIPFYIDHQSNTIVTITSMAFMGSDFHSSGGGGVSMFVFVNYYLLTHTILHKEIYLSHIIFIVPN